MKFHMIVLEDKNQIQKLMYIPQYLSSGLYGRALAPSRYPYAPFTGYLVNLTSLQRWQDLCTFHVSSNIFIHGNTTEIKTAMMKITGSISINTPVLMRPTLTNHECCSPYNRQSSRMSFTATTTSYIRVTQILKLCMETTSPYEGHTSCPSFSRLLHPTSGLLSYTSRFPKILHWLHLTLLTMLGLWGAPYE